MRPILAACIAVGVLWAVDVTAVIMVLHFQDAQQYPIPIKFMLSDKVHRVTSWRIRPSHFIPSSERRAVRRPISFGLAGLR